MSKLTEVLSLQAENELEDALYFYDLISTKIGDNFLNQINTCIESILLNPETYKLEFDIYRQAVVKKFPFVIIYTKIDSKILISAIFHTSKNPNKKFKFSHSTNKKPQLLSQLWSFKILKLEYFQITLSSIFLFPQKRVLK